MKERLVIKNFGPIKSVDLELGKMIILIGEQATGKSTIAKVLAVCRYFSFITNATNNLIHINNIYFDNILKEYGIHEYINDKSYVLYDCVDYKLEITIVHDGKFISNLDKNRAEPFLMFLPEIINEKSLEFKTLMNEFRKINTQRPSGDIGTQYLRPNWNIPTSFLLNDVKKVMNNPFYFPTERGLQSIFSLGKDSIQNLSSLLYNQFAKLNEISNNHNKEIFIKPLGVSYKNINGLGYVKKEKEENFYALNTGASGYQSAVPIVLGINFYTNFEDRKNRIFIVEEPELNLFPKAQKKLMDFFVDNINSNGHSFLLPTHSPYFLSAINDLLMAFKKGQKNQSEVEKFVNKESWLNPNDLSVYQLKNGFAYDIFDKECSLIGENIIDEVSDQMNDEFEELLDIK